MRKPKPTIPTKTNRSLIIDANNLVIRNFFALPFFSTEDGTPTNAVFGTLNRLKESLEIFKPVRLYIIWDGGAGETWRHRIFPGYKESRRIKTAEKERFVATLYPQFKLLEDLISETLRLPMLRIEHCEADDLIACAALSMKEGQVVIISTDKDFWQLVTRRVLVYDPLRVELIDLENFEDVTKFPGPDLFLDYRIINGDSSDSIPRVDGLSGEKKFADYIDGFRRIHLPRLLRRGEQSFGRDVLELFGTKLGGKFLSRFNELRRNWVLMDLRFAAEQQKTTWENVGWVTGGPCGVGGALNRHTVFERFRELEFKSILNNFDRWIQPIIDFQNQKP